LLKESLLLEGFELIELYRQDPVLAAYDLLNLKFAPAHRIILRDMWHKNFVIAVCCRGFGKSFLFATVAVLSALLYPGYRVGLIAPTYRQSKHIFLEIEKMYQKSPIFQAACEKKPTRGSDSCYVKFKGAPGSWIEALPLGDGTKIRGSRFYTILVDEFAFMPAKVFSTVIKPMAVVSRDPMENVERIKQQEKLIAKGLLDPKEIDEESANKILAASTGFFKFNHMWDKMKEYWKKIDAGDSRYAVHQIPYWDLPKGFLDLTNIEEAKSTMSAVEFQMEYEALMVDDSDGAFKASLLEACTEASNHSIELRGIPGAEYVLGVDTASKRDHFAVVVVKLGTKNQIVNVLDIEGASFPDMARSIYRLCDNYNVIRIMADRFGGGESLKDILALGLDGFDPILEYDDKSPRMGRRLLELCTPSPKWITDANFGAKALLEKREVLFPLPPSSSSDKEADSFDLVRKMKSQILNIVMTQNTYGTFKFNTPKKGMHKDLYSAFILACWGITKLRKEKEEGGQQQPVILQHGLVQPREIGGAYGYGYIS